MSYLNATNSFVETIAEELCHYLYELASIVEGDADRHSTYLDAGDALMDVVAMWKDDEGFFNGGPTPVVVSEACE